MVVNWTHNCLYIWRSQKSFNSTLVIGNVTTIFREILASCYETRNRNMSVHWPCCTPRFNGHFWYASLNRYSVRISAGTDYATSGISLAPVSNSQEHFKTKSGLPFPQPSPFSVHILTFFIRDDKPPKLMQRRLIIYETNEELIWISKQNLQYCQGQKSITVV